MNIRNHFYANAMLGASLLAFSHAAWALGLGEATVESFLGEPLAVNIALITQPSDDLASVSAGLASAGDYDLIGASRDDISVPLSFSVEDLDGSAYITVRSKQVLKNPVVRLILEVNWTSGRMLREYTLFLDPPTISQPAPAPRIEEESATAPPPPAEARQAEPAPAPSQAVPTSDSGTVISGADEYGPVQSGENLWTIAKDWSRGSGMNLNKVMLAIQRKNPEAFANNNINLLHRGAILRMPDAEEVNSMSTASANSEVTSQEDVLASQRTMASPTTPLVSEASVAVDSVEEEKVGLQGVEDEIGESEADLGLHAEEELAEEERAEEVEPLPESEPVEAEPSDQLELVPPSEDNPLDSTYGFEESEDNPDASASAQVLREELSRKEEELINQQQQNAYLEQRLQELESQLEESREGTVDEENLASMEERLRQERLADAQAAEQQAVTPASHKEPWYSRFWLWLLGALVLVVALVGWLMTRSSGSGDDVTDPLRELKDEAEDVLRVLDPESEAEAEAETEAEAEAVEEDLAAEEQTVEGDADKDSKSDSTGKPASGQDDEAHMLDEESADPEIQLDLARAYISMGDKEAARVILEEVMVNGTEEQQAEADKMKKHL
jgi:pilus assembly protein FimV